LKSTIWFDGGAWTGVGELVILVSPSAAAWAKCGRDDLDREPFEAVVSCEGSMAGHLHLLLEAAVPE
jgi:hypothetical protein